MNSKALNIVAISLSFAAVILATCALIYVRDTWERDNAEFLTEQYTNGINYQKSGKLRSADESLQRVIDLIGGRQLKSESLRKIRDDARSQLAVIAEAQKKNEEDETRRRQTEHAERMRRHADELENIKAAREVIEKAAQEHQALLTEAKAQIDLIRKAQLDEQQLKQKFLDAENARRAALTQERADRNRRLAEAKTKEDKIQARQDLLRLDLELELAQNFRLDPATQLLRNVVNATKNPAGMTKDDGEILNEAHKRLRLEIQKLTDQYGKSLPSGAEYRKGLRNLDLSEDGVKAMEYHVWAMSKRDGIAIAIARNKLRLAGFSESLVQSLEDKFNEAQDTRARLRSPR